MQPPGLIVQRPARQVPLPVWRKAPCAASPRRGLCLALSAQGVWQRPWPRPSRWQLVRDLLSLLQPRDLLHLLLGCLGLLSSSLCELLSPPLAAAALFAALQGRAALGRCLGVAALALLQGLADGLRSFAFNMLRSSLVANLRAEAFKVLITQEKGAQSRTSFKDTYGVISYQVLYWFYTITV